MTALFPGSFDPVTLGHMDIIKRSSAMFDRLIVAVMNNMHKKTAFGIEERVGFLSLSVKGIKNVEVREYSGLLTDFFISSKADVIIRGLRSPAEFDHEMQYAQAFKKVNDKIETLFLPALPEHMFVSSSMAKEAALFGGDLQMLVPGGIIKDIQQKFNAGGL